MNIAVFFTHKGENMNGSIFPKIARDAIVSRLDGEALDKNRYVEAYPEWELPGATFVTLTKHGNLRGCIGSIIAHRPLIEDLISNAQSAAFRDPRFPPLSPEELHEIDIEVSLLTPPRLVEYSDIEDLQKKIRPYIDGVILRLGEHQATFLPQVWDELDEFEEFFVHLGLKAGIGSNPLSFHPEIYIYQVEKFEEEA